MRKKRANRWNSQSEHNSYGIYNWFKSKGVTNVDIIKEVLYNFCINNGFQNLSPKTPEHSITNFVGNRFNKFAPFAGKFLKDNNYIQND